MKTFCTTLVASLLLISPALAVAENAAREVEVKLPSLSDVETSCVEQLRKTWAQPGVYDDTVTRITLDTIYHRRENQNNVVVFQGHAYNSFLQTDRGVTVTCRLAEKPPYAVSFQIDR